MSVAETAEGTDSRIPGGSGARQPPAATTDVVQDRAAGRGSADRAEPFSGSIQAESTAPDPPTEAAERVARDGAFYIPDGSENPPAETKRDRAANRAAAHGDAGQRPRSAGSTSEAAGGTGARATRADALAERLEALAERLRLEGPSVLSASLGSADRLEAHLAALLSGYLAADDT